MNEWINDKISDSLKEEFFNAKTDFFFKDGDSKVPYISFNDGFVNGIYKQYVSIMFIKNGVSYFLDNEFGHTAYENSKIVINECLTHTWQLSKREFIYAKKCILEMLVNCSDEYKKLCLDAIDELDYEKGRANAYFQIIINKVDRSKVDRLRFNFRNLFYDLMLDDNSILRGNIDDPWSHLNKREVKGLEKRLVLGIMKHSKTLKDKLNEIEK